MEPKVGGNREGDVAREEWEKGTEDSTGLAEPGSSSVRNPHLNQCSSLRGTAGEVFRKHTRTTALKSSAIDFPKDWELSKTNSPCIGQRVISWLYFSHRFPQYLSKRLDSRERNRIWSDQTSSYSSTCVVYDLCVSLQNEEKPNYRNGDTDQSEEHSSPTSSNFLVPPYASGLCLNITSSKRLSLNNPSKDLL